MNPRHTILSYRWYKIVATDHCVTVRTMDKVSGRYYFWGKGGLCNRACAVLFGKFLVDDILNSLSTIYKDSIEEKFT